VPVGLKIHVGTPGFEGALAAELQDAAPRVLVPGVIACDVAPADAALVDPVFARQVLPDAVEVGGASVRALAEAAFSAVEGAIDRWPGAFTMHAFPPPEPPDDDAPTTLPGARAAHTRARAARRQGPRDEGARAGAKDGGLGSRVALVEDALLTLVAERRKRASRRYLERVASADFDARVLLVQLLLVARDRLLVCAAAPRPLPRGGLDLAPWPGGAAPVVDDRAPPSRAYRKLEEAFQWMGAAPRAGETCVDLGAAPGSWTLVAARRGAEVLAVDRAPLAPAVARTPGVTAVIGNAFTYEPPRPVDWLLADVVCEPARAIDLVGDWLTAKRSRNLVVTVKFKGREQYGALAALGPVLDEARPTFGRIKQLRHNKNEVTVMIRAAC
jgi:23S rRNA C2498 (ribose-2'-O)-methylase RlmM